MRWKTLIALAAFVPAIAAACGASGHPPPARDDCAPVRCTATARHCRSGIVGGACPNNDYTAPEPRQSVPEGECFYAAAVPFDPQRECTARLCSTCIAPECIDCVAAVAPGSCPGCGGYPTGAAGGVLPPPSQIGPPPATPKPFRLRGYEFTPSALTSDIVYEFGFDTSLGAPQDISAIEDVFYASRPASLGGIELSISGTTVTADLAFSSSLTGMPPTTLDGFTLPGTAPGPKSFDAFLGSDYETRWFNVHDGTPSSVRRIELAGQVSAWAATPFFAVIDEKPAALTNVLESEVCYVDYSIVNPPNQTRCRSTADFGGGAPYGVTAAQDQAWLVTQQPNKAFHVLLPSLEATQQIDINGVPVAASGGTLQAAFLSPGGCQGSPPVPNPHVAIAIAVGGRTEVRAYPGGNLLSSSVLVHSFEGAPVTMHTAAVLGTEYGWLATKNPNRLYRFVISNPGASVDSVDLDSAEPIRLVVGGTGGKGASGSPNCYDVEETIRSGLDSGILHVLVKTP